MNGQHIVAIEGTPAAKTILYKLHLLSILIRGRQYSPSLNLSHGTECGADYFSHFTISCLSRHQQTGHASPEHRILLINE